MNSYREIESKWALLSSFDDARDSLLSFFYEIEPGAILDCQTIDYYWESPGSSQFVRLRNSWGKRANGSRKELKEITTKKKDKGSNIDRLEINVAVESILDTKKMLSLVLGNPLGRVKKKETVLFLKDAVISLSTINEETTFVEIEAGSLESVERYYRELSRCLSLGERENRSFFEIYVEGNKNEAA